MAALQQTWSGDLSAEIAGRIVDAVKNIGNDKKIEESDASPEVKQAAKELNRSDNKSTPVKDPELRETVSKLFGLELDAKLIAFEGKIERVSDSVKTVGAGVVDVQKLLIDQNSLLEAKLTEMLGVLTKKNEFMEQEREDFLEDQEAADIAGQSKTFGTGGSLRTTVTKGMEVPATKIARRLFGSLFKKQIQNILRSGGSLMWRFTPKFLKNIIIGAKSFARRRIIEKPLFWLSNRRAFRAFVHRLHGTVGRRNLFKFAKRAAPSGINVAAKQLGRKKVVDQFAKAGLRKAGKEATKRVISKKFAKTGTSTAAKQIAKANARMGVRSTAGNLPLVGFGTGLIFATQRLLEGDPIGAVLEAASGITAGLGFFGVSAGIDIGILGRDLSKIPQQEKGTNLTKKGLTMLHGTEAVIGSDDRNDMIDSSISSLSTIVSSATDNISKEFASNKAVTKSTTKDISSIEIDKRSQPRGYEGVHDFGVEREHPETGEPYTHLAEDYDVKSGTPIIANKPGRVNSHHFGHDDALAGGNVMIDHDTGKSMRYLHLKRILVKPGDLIHEGDVIGYTGGAAGDYGQGNSTGQHLHLEYYPGGIDQDPEDPKKVAPGYFRFGVTSSSGKFNKVAGGKGGDDLALEKLKARIRKAESDNDYGAIWSGATGQGFPGENKDITQMTIQEVHDHQTEYLLFQKNVLGRPYEERSAAMGAYQMLWLREAADALGISRDTLFNKQTQDKLFMYFINPQWQQFQAGEITGAEFNDHLASKFASIQDSSGVGVYDNDGINTARHNILDFIESLKPVDKEDFGRYQGFIDEQRRAREFFLKPHPREDELLKGSAIMEDLEEMVALTQPSIIVQNQAFQKVKKSNDNIVIIENNFLEDYRIARLGV